jgi:multidrug resistance efflux pump
MPRPIPLFACALALVALAGIARPEDAPKDEATAEPKTVEATKGPFAPEVEAAGAFVPEGAVEVAFRPKAYGAELEVVEASRGGPVAKGAVLVRFDTEKIDEQIQAATADLAVATENLARVTEEVAIAEEATTVGLARSEFDAKRSEEAFKSFTEVERPLRTRESEHRVQGIRDNIQDQEEELAQLEKMYKADELTEETEEIVLKRAKRQLERSRLGLGFQLERQRLLLEVELPREAESLEIGRRKAKTDWERAQAVAKPSLRHGRMELEKAKAALERQGAALARLRSDREAMTVVSPAAGVAVAGSFWNGKWQGLDDLEKALRPGRRAPANQTLYTVFAPGTLRVRATVPEAVVLRVKAGASAKVVPTADPSVSLSAKVTEVASVSADGQYEIALDPEGADPRLVPGHACKVTITGLEAKDAVTVPTTALRKDGEKGQVFVLEDGKPVAKDVKVGGSAGGRTEVTEGLEPGTRVLETAPAK